MSIHQATSPKAPGSSHQPSNCAQAAHALGMGLRMRRMMTGKIHRVTVTGADLHYVGSITIDADLLDGADILPGQEVDVVDITNGARLTTYAIPGERGSGVISINGAAAHLINEAISRSSSRTRCWTMRAAAPTSRVWCSWTGTTGRSTCRVSRGRLLKTPTWCPRVSRSGSTGAKSLVQVPQRPPSGTRRLIRHGVSLWRPQRK